MNEYLYIWWIIFFYGNCIVLYFYLKKINELNFDFIGCYCKFY